MQNENDEMPFTRLGNLWSFQRYGATASEN